MAPRSGAATPLTPSPSLSPAMKAAKAALWSGCQRDRAGRLRMMSSAAQRIRFSSFATDLGRVLIAATENGVCAVKLGGDAQSLKRLLAEEFSAAELVEEPMPEIEKNVRAFTAGEGTLARVPVDIRGTVFQRRVWEALRRIPRGETRTYSEIARAIGAPAAVRAVGSACGANPVALVVPCHRAVRADGGLGGYAWGLPVKKRLLEIEKRRRK